jgi:nucleotide-binding universal stress UspA family protein
MESHMLLFTNGNESTWPSIEYATWIAAKMRTPLILIGVLEERGGDIAVEDIFSRAVTLFQENKIEYSLQLESGHVEEIISRKAASELTELVVFGPFGRPALRRFLMGRSFRHLLAEISTPILYVPTVRLPLRKMLICLGGLGYGLTAEHLGVKLARVTGAAVTLLTVVPPIDLDYPEAQKIRTNWQTLAETDTLPGRTLRKAIEAALEVEVTVRVVTRQGNVVEEIRAEIKEGNYDIICMGSPYSAHSLRQLYSPNVTADVAEAAECPILTARFALEETKTAS